MSRPTIRRLGTAAALLASLAGAAIAWPASSSALGPATTHLAVIFMENKEYGSVVGDVNAPYINDTLIPSGRRFTQYYATMHPSLPNYLVLSSGSYAGCVTDGCPFAFDQRDNIYHQLDSTVPPTSWKVYAESMPTNCSTSKTTAYIPRHNPPLYFSDLGPGGDATCATNDVPYSELPADITAGTLPSLVEIVPNAYDDMHTDHKQAPCQLGSAREDEICQGDSWLQSNLPPLLSDGGRRDVTAVVVFDEGSTGQGGGGHVLTVEIGPNVCAGCNDSTPINHYGLLVAIEDWFGLPALHPEVPSL